MASGEKFEVGLVIRAFDKVTGPLKGINTAIKQFSSPLRQLNNGFRGLSEAAGFGRISDSFGRVRESVGRVSSAVFALGTKLAILGGIGAAAAIEGVKSTVEWASKIHDLSEATGASVQNIQTLGFALRQAGGDEEVFTKGIRNFAVGLGDAHKKGASPLVKTLRAIDPKGLREVLKTKDTGDALRRTIGILSKIKDDPKRLAAASAIFGKKTSQAFAVLAQEGPAAMAKVEKSLVKVFGKDEIDQMEAFGDTTGGLFEQLKTVGRAFVSEATPALKEFFDGLTEQIGQNGPQIREMAHDFGVWLPKGIKQARIAISDLWTKMKPLREMVNEYLPSASSKLAAALVMLAAIMLGPTISAIAGLAASLISLGATIMGTPIGWLAGGVALMALQMWGAHKAGQALGQALVEAFQHPLALAKDLLNAIRDIANFLSGNFLLQGMRGEGWNPFKYGGLSFDNTRQAIDDSEGKKNLPWKDIKRALGHKMGFLTGIQKDFIASAPPAPPAELPGDRNLGAAGLRKQIATQTIVRDSEITISFQNEPKGMTVDVPRNQGNKITINRAPLGVQGVS